MKDAFDSLPLAEKLIAEAKSNFPLSVHYTGRLTPKEQERINEECLVSIASARMEGFTYSIRWSKADAGGSR